MKQELKSQITASLIRQMFFARMLHKENAHFLKFPVPSNIKATLKRMKDNYTNGVNQLGSHLLVKEIEASDEKIDCLCNIFEKLSMLNEDELQRLEETVDSIVSIEYK